MQTYLCNIYFSKKHLGIIVLNRSKSYKIVQIHIIVIGGTSLDFHEYLQMLYPFLGDGKIHSDFLVKVITNIMEDTDGDQCPLLDAKPEYLKRIYNGKKPIVPKNATFVISHLDKDRFMDFICSFPVDTLQKLAIALMDKGIITNGSDVDIAEKCTNILEQIFLNISSRTKENPSTGKVAVPTDNIDEAVNKLDQILASFPKPKEILPPDEIEEHEHCYVSELYRAYGDAEGIKDFDNETLSIFAEYDDDLKDRRIDYFAAEAIRREISEIYDGRYADQFEVLKSETYSGVKNTARRAFPNGYERLLAVMEQATMISVDKYWLSRSPFWISNNIKMGTCHFLVNDGKLKWVK